MNTMVLRTVATGLMLLAATAPAQPLAIGAALPAADVEMRNVDGRMLTLADIRGKAGTLVIFSCNHCPFVKAWQDRMVEIANDGVAKGLGVVFVNSNDPATFPEDSLETMKQVARDKGFAFPYVVDESSGVARAFGASRTPESFLFDAAGKLVYHGTIDDSTYDAGNVKHPYLKEAVQALLADKRQPVAETKSVGCSIKFRTPPTP